MSYKSLQRLREESGSVLKPTERLTVSEAAKKYRHLNNNGSYVGPWRNEMVPYMVEFMDVLGDDEHQGVAFIGPKQTGKTEIFLNFVSYSALCDAGDILMIQTSQTVAEEFGVQRVQKLLRDSKEVGKAAIGGAEKQNIKQYKFKNGSLVFLGHPAASQLRGKPIRRVWITDYDTLPKSIDGEGSAYQLGEGRTQSFKRFGKTVVESTISKPVVNPKWVPKTAHEAPPTDGGILEVYNSGDRRRWYWICYDCSEAYEPDFKEIRYDEKEFKETGNGAHVVCPHCGAGHVYDETRVGHKTRYEMNLTGLWLAEGESWNPILRKKVGNKRRSKIASFWMKGPAAAFITLNDLVEKYIRAKDMFESTQNEEALRVTVNTDQALPYIPVNSTGGLVPENLKAGAKKIPMGVVPHGARYLIATVDVQRSRFAVLITGMCANGDMAVVDRFDIRKSKRLDEDGERYPITPGAYPEDWDHLIEEVMLLQYPLQDAPDRVMHIKATCCDSGGDEGVTLNAYEFVRRLRNHDEYANLNRRFRLVKGSKIAGSFLLREIMPNSDRKDRNAGGRGDVPVYELNSNMIKDQVKTMLEREGEGGKVNFPALSSDGNLARDNEGFQDKWYDEIVAESRNDKGQWENKQKKRNETWDLLCYAYVLNRSALVRGDRIDWQSPPSWAEEWAVNDLVADVGKARFSLEKKALKDFSRFGKSLASG